MSDHGGCGVLAQFYHTLFFLLPSSRAKTKPGVVFLLCMWGSKSENPSDLSQTTLPARSRTSFHSQAHGAQSPPALRDPALVMPPAHTGCPWILAKPVSRRGRSPLAEGLRELQWPPQGSRKLPHKARKQRSRAGRDFLVYCLELPGTWE